MTRQLAWSAFLLFALVACKRGDSAGTAGSGAPASSGSAAAAVQGGLGEKEQRVANLTEADVSKNILKAEFYGKKWRIADIKKIDNGTEYRIENLVEDDHGHGKGKVAARVVLAQADGAEAASRLADRLTAGKEYGPCAAFYGGDKVLMVEVLEGLEILKGVTAFDPAHRSWPAEAIADNISQGVEDWSS